MNFTVNEFRLKGHGNYVKYNENMNLYNLSLFPDKSI